MAVALRARHREEKTMKSNKRKLITTVVLALLAVALIAVPAVAMRGRASGGHRGMGRGMGPAFTAEQQEQMEKIHDKYADERAELTNRLKVIMLEARDVDTDAAPDYKAIEKNIEEVSAIRVKLAKLRLQIHKEIRPLLGDDQKVLFDRGLGGMLHGGMGGQGHPGMMGRRGGMDCMMGRGGTMGCGAMGGRGAMSGPGAMGCGAMGGPGMAGATPGQMAPWCPFADNAADDEADDD
jgi:Spy/CpxP family protein refolding chaperone